MFRRPSCDALNYAPATWSLDTFVRRASRSGTTDFSRSRASMALIPRRPPAGRSLRI